MKIQRSLFRIAVALTLLFAGAGSAYAQATRTWVSGVGDDANPCSRTAPCKTLAGAISKTAAKGIIDILDPAGVGAVTITKSITIENIGMINGILASGTNGIIVNAAATDTVILRGVSIDGAGSTLGVNGIRFLAGGQLVVENCTIQNFSQNGIDFEPSGSATLSVQNTTINNVAGSAILLQPGASGSATATISNTRLLQSGFGIFANKATVSLKSVVISGNASGGVKALGSNSITTKINIDDSTVTDNPLTGINAQGSLASVTISRTSISNNGTGVSISLAGKINSFGNNRIFGNTSDGTVTALLSEQ